MCTGVYIHIVHVGWTHRCETKGLQDCNSPNCTLSQNGYGVCNCYMRSPQNSRNQQRHVALPKSRALPIYLSFPLPHHRLAPSLLFRSARLSSILPSPFICMSLSLSLTHSLFRSRCRSLALYLSLSLSAPLHYLPLSLSAATVPKTAPCLSPQLFCDMLLAALILSPIILSSLLFSSPLLFSPLLSSSLLFSPPLSSSLLCFSLLLCCHTALSPLFFSSRFCSHLPPSSLA
jgi:hypothetical protein